MRSSRRYAHAPPSHPPSSLSIWPYAGLSLTGADWRWQVPYEVQTPMPPQEVIRTVEVVREVVREVPHLVEVPPQNLKCRINQKAKALDLE